VTIGRSCTCVSMRSSKIPTELSFHRTLVDRVMHSNGADLMMKTQVLGEFSRRAAGACPRIH